MGKSHQRGWVVERGKKWYGYYRKIVLDPITNERKTDVLSVVLGLKSQLTKGAAREALQKEIAKQTGQNLSGKIMKDGSVTFGWFVRNRYYPLRDWRPETEKVKKIQIERDLVEKFETVSLDAFEQFILQKHLKHLATFLSEDRVKHARSYMKSIFAEAVEQDFLLKDPTRGIKIPRNLREKDKTTLTWHQLRAVLASVTTRDRMLLTLEMTDALRPSELFALRWRSFDGSKLTISESKQSTEERFGRLAKRKRALGTFYSRREWSMISGCGSRSALTLHRIPSFSPTPTVGSWIRAITGTES